MIYVCYNIVPYKPFYSMKLICSKKFMLIFLPLLDFITKVLGHFHIYVLSHFDLFLDEKRPW